MTNPAEFILVSVRIRVIATGDCAVRINLRNLTSTRCVTHAEAARAEGSPGEDGDLHILTNGSYPTMRKILFAASVAALAIGAPLAAASSALADSQPLITVGESSCVAPWYWEGPLDVATNVSTYSACNGHGEPAKQGKLLGVLDNSCLLPWHWKGPGNVLTGLLGGAQTPVKDYHACDGAPQMPPAPQLPCPPNMPPAPGQVPAPADAQAADQAAQTADQAAAVTSQAAAMTAPAAS
jgi:hypothetical protein